MLRSMNDQLNYRMEATDGYAGSLSDFLIDDSTWNIRYAVIDTGNWLPGRKVLMAREGLGEPDWSSQTIPVSCTREWIESAPSLAQERPVSRQYEEYLHEHYNWAPYWSPGLSGGMSGSPVAPADTGGTPPPAEALHKGDPHLRSFRELTGYRVIVGGEKVGRVDNFMCYDDTWEVPFVVANVGGWFHKEALMIPTTRVSDISFVDRQLSFSMKKEALDDLPAYDPFAEEGGRLEVCVYDYRGRLLSHAPVEGHGRRRG